MKRVSLLLFPFMQACAVGYTSQLLITRSNFGVDIDSKPPRAEISVARGEGTIGPTLEGGQTLPVMTSFKAQNSWLNRFVFGVSSTFATGEAAVTMSDLFEKDTPSSAPQAYDGECLSELPEGKTALHDVPWLRAIFCKALFLDKLICRPKPLIGNNMRPMFFGTDTVLGLKAEWTGETGQYPSAVKFGFNRKELAWVPVGYYKGDTAAGQCPYYARTPAVLAVLDNETAVGSKPPIEAAKASKELDAELGDAGDKGSKKPDFTPTETTFKYMQYFATGRAAANLAKQRAVRAAMLARLAPEATTETVSFASDEQAKQLLCWISQAGAERAARLDLIDAECIPHDADYAREDLLTMGGEPWITRRRACAEKLGDKITCEENP